MEKEGNCSANFTRDVIVVGLGGASNGGKTTLTQRLAERHPSAIIIHQDDFFYKDEELLPWSTQRDTRMWDVLEALDVDKLVGEVQSSISKATQSHREPRDITKSDCPSSLVIVEGTQILSIRALEPFLSVAWFITLDYDTMRERRRVKLYDGLLDLPGYFEKHVWTGYMRDFKIACNAHKDGSIKMLDGVSENLEEVDAVINELLERTR